MSLRSTQAPLLFKILLALTAWFGVILQWCTFIVAWQLQGKTIGAELIHFFSYFTILTNSMVAIIITIPLLSPFSRPGKWLTLPQTLSAAAVYIVIVGLVYNIVLRPLYHPQGWARLADEIVHSVVPFLFMLYWILFTPKGNLVWHHAFTWLLYPFLYLVYTYIHGYISHYYPYPFMDVNVIGYTGFFTNSGYLLLVFVFFNLAVISVDKRIVRRRRQNITTS